VAPRAQGQAPCVPSPIHRLAIKYFCLQRCTPRVRWENRHPLHATPPQPGSLLLTAVLLVVGRLLLGRFARLRVLSASEGFQPSLFYCCHPSGNRERKTGYWRQEPSCTCCLPSFLQPQTLLQEYLALSETSIAAKARERLITFSFTNWFHFPVRPTPGWTLSCKTCKSTLRFLSRPPAEAQFAHLNHSTQADWSHGVTAHLIFTNKTVNNTVQPWNRLLQHKHGEARLKVKFLTIFYPNT